jgi:DNA-binding CsgD family transcriptional regulator
MTDSQLRTAAILWQQGCNTYEIANSLQLPESTVYNFIGEIKRIAFAHWRSAA